MARKALIHKNTTLTTNNGGVISPKLPTAGTLRKGEIAVNYKDGYETLSIENDLGEVVPFASLEQTMAYTDASIVNADWNATSGKAQILNKPDIPDEKLSSSYQTSTLENDNLLLAGGDTYETAFSKIEKAILDNEETIAASLNDLNTRKIEIDDVPTKTSQLINDSNFTTLSEVTLTIVNSAPGTLDTLNELAAALGNDPNFATTIATQIGNKADKSNITAGTYKSVTVNNQGIVTGGTNPTTLTGYGITDAIDTSSTAQTKVGNLTAAKFITKNGTSSQVVMGDGSLVDSRQLPQYEAFLEWGGKNFTGSYGPIDAAMVSELGAPRTMFAKAAGIVVEYSTDGGNNWVDYGANDTQKVQLFSTGYSFRTGKNTSASSASINNMLRVSLYTSAASIYTELNKFVIFVSTNGSSGCYCTIRCRTQQNYEDNVDTWVTKAEQVPISGFSGYNVINISTTRTYGNAKATQYGEWQFIFGYTGHSGSYPGLAVSKIFGFGGVGWICPSTMAKTGHLYSFDENQNAIFPAQVQATSFKKTEGTSSQFLKADGSVDSNTYLTSHQLLKTINNESLIGSGNITIRGGSGGDVNVIETVKVNGTALTPDSNKAVDITSIPASIVIQDTTHRFVSDTEKTTWNNKVSNVQSDWNATSGMGVILNKPTIPTVNNATLTIQKNGTTVNTFTANASSNVTANILVNELPTVSNSDNGKVLMVVNGAWAAVTPVTVYTGTSTPNNSLGNNGDLYVLTS